MDELFRYQPALSVTSLLGSPMSTRLEPQSLSGDPATGLRAQVWDPLWLLARQWQLGEWVGEDTGTPLTVRVRATAEPLVAWRPGAASPVPEAWRPLEPGALLEPLTDAERAPEPSPRALALAGWALLETLEDLDEQDAVEALLRHHPLEPPADGHPHGDHDEVARADVPDAWSAVVRTLSGRTIDPLAAAATLGRPHPPGWWRNALRPDAEHRAATRRAVDHWLAWFRAEVAPAPDGDVVPDSWIGPRLEHEFAVATPSHVLRAPSHPGGEVTWSSFDLAPDEDLPVSDAPPRHLDRTVLATPLSFPGLPASRFWELEDGRVDLGSAWADPHELARLLVVECALVHGGDWLAVPVDAPAGSVVALDAVTYTDTFGTTWEVETAGADTPLWRMYTVTTGEASEQHLAGLVVPPASAGHLQGPALEDVAFLRDEAANLVWAVERLVPGPGGDPVVPRATVPPSRPSPTPGLGEPVLDHQLMTPVPEPWVPYLPRLGTFLADDAVGAHPAVVLVRGHAVRYDGDGGGLAVAPSGRLLTGPEHRWVESAEVPRTGVRVQRVPVAARHGDGTWASWTARRVLSGRGEGESGLRFDLAVRPRV